MRSGIFQKRRQPGMIGGLLVETACLAPGIVGSTIENPKVMM